MHIRPILEYCSSVWNLGYIADINLLESVQRRWTKNIQGMEHLDQGFLTGGIHTPWEYGNQMLGVWHLISGYLYVINLNLIIYTWVEC